MTCSKTKKRCNSANNCSIIIFIFTCWLCNSITAFELGVVDEVKTTPADWNVHDTNKRTFLNLSNQAGHRRRLIPGNNCYEAYLPDYLNNPDCCSGTCYEKYAYKCVGDWCAAINPPGNPAQCATNKGSKYIVDATTGRCQLGDPITAYCESACAEETDQQNCKKHGQHNLATEIYRTCGWDSATCWYDRSADYRSNYRSDSCDAFCGRMGTTCNKGMYLSNNWCGFSGDIGDITSCANTGVWGCSCNVPTCSCCPPGRYSSTASTMEQAVLHASQASTTTKIVKRQSTVVSPVFQVHTVLLVPHNANHVAKDSMLQH